MPNEQQNRASAIDHLQSELRILQEQQWYHLLLYCNPDIEKRILENDTEKRRLLLGLHSLEKIAGADLLSSPLVLGVYVRRFLDFSPETAAGAFIEAREKFRPMVDREEVCTSTRTFRVAR